MQELGPTKLRAIKMAMQRHFDANLMALPFEYKLTFNVTWLLLETEPTAASHYNR